MEAGRKSLAFGLDLETFCFLKDVSSNTDEVIIVHKKTTAERREVIVCKTSWWEQCVAAFDRYDFRIGLGVIVNFFLAGLRLIA